MHDPPDRDLSPRVAFRTLRALEGALLAAAPDDGVVTALDSLEAALRSPSVDDGAVLEAVHGLEEAADGYAGRRGRWRFGDERGAAASCDEDRRPVVKPGGRR